MKFESVFYKEKRETVTGFSQKILYEMEGWLLESYLANPISGVEAVSGLPEATSSK